MVGVMRMNALSGVRAGTGPAPYIRKHETNGAFWKALRAKDNEHAMREMQAYMPALKVQTLGNEKKN